MDDDIMHSKILLTESYELIVQSQRTFDSQATNIYH